MELRVEQDIKSENHDFGPVQGYIDPDLEGNTPKCVNAV
jgi:hypothetical protein